MAVIDVDVDRSDSHPRNAVQCRGRVECAVSVSARLSSSRLYRAKRYNDRMGPIANAYR